MDTVSSDENKNFDHIDFLLEENSLTTKSNDSEVTPDVRKLILNIEETKKIDMHNLTNESTSKTTTSFKKGNLSKFFYIN